MHRPPVYQDIQFDDEVFFRETVNKAEIVNLHFQSQRLLSFLKYLYNTFMFQVTEVLKINIVDRYYTAKFIKRVLNIKPYDLF